MRSRRTAPARRLERRVSEIDGDLVAARGDRGDRGVLALVLAAPREHPSARCWTAGGPAGRRVEGPIAQKIDLPLPPGAV